MAEAIYEYIEIANTSELLPGERMIVEINDVPIAIFNLNGRLCAIKDECTHDHGPLGEGKVEGNIIVCPRHGARFDICSGKPVSTPAFQPTESYPVRVTGDLIEIGIPETGK
jgi:3-phenylpropionate/trans-cinnamate dioxygenase ferredoxin component